MIETLIEITEAELNVGEVMSFVRHPDCGAEVCFVGTTRQWTNKTSTDAAQTRIETSHLVYTSYDEMAIAQISEMLREASERWPIKKAAIVHRKGKVLPEEPSVVVVVSAPHRSEAFDAGEWLIDTLKHTVPIWKQEHYVQSGSEWIHPSSGSCHCSEPNVTQR